MIKPYEIMLAPNASMLTGNGTNTIIIGGKKGETTVIDPGDDNPTHLEAIIEAGKTYGGIQRILISHGHPDHMGGAATLRERLSVPIYAYNRAGVAIADEELADGKVFSIGSDTLRVIYTPGHRFDHLCFLLEKSRTLFAGDMLAGEGTVVIIPPEGDMLDYLNSLQRLKKLDILEIVPAHGPIITEPDAKLQEYITHRLQREQQIIEQLSRVSRETTVAELVEQIYINVDQRLHALAAQSVTAHLLKLEKEGRTRQVEQGSWLLID